MGNWDRISGQDKLIQYFERAAARKQISHAYIIEGEPGTPKTELAEGFARMLQCENGTGCGTCHSCLAFDGGNHPDVVHVTHEKPDTIRIDEIRDQLVNDMGIRPYSSPYKIYLVDDAEKMNVQAQNALLKTLEEPPYYGIIILTTVNSGAFLPTILSRTVVLTCQNTGEGETLLSPEQTDSVLSVLKSVWDYDRTRMANTAAEWKKSEIPVNLLMNVVRIWYRDVLVRKSLQDDSRLILTREIRGIREAAERYSYAQVNRILQAADLTEQRIASNVSYELAMELFLNEMTVKKKDEKKEDDSWDDHFPDFEEARFYSESYEQAMADSMR